jgi:hypothetical protein
VIGNRDGRLIVAVTGNRDGRLIVAVIGNRDGRLIVAVTGNRDEGSLSLARLRRNTQPRANRL